MKNFRNLEIKKMVQQLEFFPLKPFIQFSGPKSAVPYIPGSETSKAAAASIGGKARTLRQQVLDFIRQRREYGATDQEIAEDLALTLNTARPRRVELRDAGLIVDSGHTRPTQSGRLATVWVIFQGIAVYE
jgi:hypothetical protein